MTTLTVFLINVYAHLIIFLSILISNKSEQIEQDLFQKFQKN
jgi:preprotein translocase subunit SecG